jgi:hypothetical protein
MKCVLLMFLVASNATAAENAFDPHWSVGDAWEVEYSFEVEAIRADADDDQPAPFMDSQTFTYEVRSADGSSAVILVEPVPNGGMTMFEGPRYELHFGSSGRNERHLASIGLLKADGNSRRATWDNPLSGNSWMMRESEWTGPVILDFPLLPADGIDAVTAIQPQQSSPRAFKQATVFSGGWSTTMFVSTNPVSDCTDSVTFSWKAGKKWWSSAVIRSGDKVRGFGRLVESPSK